MHTKRHRQQAEDRRERAEEGRQHTETQRDINEQKRQMAEKHREVGELFPAQASLRYRGTMGVAWTLRQRESTIGPVIEWHGRTGTVGP